MPRVLHTLRSHKQFVQLEGLHCHLGSTIKTVTIFHDAMVYMLQMIDSLRADGNHVTSLHAMGVMLEVVMMVMVMVMVMMVMVMVMMMMVVVMTTMNMMD